MYDQGAVVSCLADCHVDMLIKSAACIDTCIACISSKLDMGGMDIRDPMNSSIAMAVLIQAREVDIELLREPRHAHYVDAGNPADHYVG